MMKLQLFNIIIASCCCSSLTLLTWAACPLMYTMLLEEEDEEQHHHRHLSSESPPPPVVDDSSSTTIVVVAAVATSVAPSSPSVASGGGGSVEGGASTTAATPPTTAAAVTTPQPTTSAPTTSTPTTSKPGTAAPSSSLPTAITNSNVTTTVLPNLFGSTNSSSGSGLQTAITNSNVTTMPNLFGSSSNSSSGGDGGGVVVTMATHTCSRLSNGNCGPTKTCASQGIVGCCSEWGWCGTSADHCGTCCQNGCQYRSSPTRKPTRRPTRQPTRKPITAPTTTCNRGFTAATYDAIESDIKRLKDVIVDVKMRTHFLGGIVRLAAHDFMDHDRNNQLPSQRFGPDGCVDFTHPNNQGLGSIWTPGAQLYDLHANKYSWISRADFWVASANAVIKITSVNNIQTSYNLGYTLRSNFKWGRIDRESCAGSGTRLAIPSRCAEVEKVFLTQMGLTWTDAVALLGGHTLGRGSSNFSGHEGTWKDNNSVAQVFDKNYYTEMLDNNWRMRNIGGPANGGPPQDFTTGSAATDNLTGRFMLNTDICLAFDIDDALPSSSPRCCTRGGGTSSCAQQCPTYPTTNSRRQAANAVAAFKSCTTNNDCFYKAFISAWNKATVLGQSGANKSLSLTCV